jgi:hypothetical protein
MVTAQMSFNMAVSIDIIEQLMMMKIKNVLLTYLLLFPLQRARRKCVIDVAKIPRGNESRKTH